MQQPDPSVFFGRTEGAINGDEMASGPAEQLYEPTPAEIKRQEKEAALAELLTLLSDPPAASSSEQAMNVDPSNPSAPSQPQPGSYRPIIPDELAAYYLQRAGFECTDVRVVRLFALAAQKFVTDVAADAYKHARTRVGTSGGRGRGSGSGRGRPPTNQPDNTATKTVLTMDDLSSALEQYGVSGAGRAPYSL